MASPKSTATHALGPRLDARCGCGHQAGTHDGSFCYAVPCECRGFRAVSMTRVMDRDTAEHFYAWLETLRDDEQHDVEQAIHALLRDHPTLVETHSWPEMRRMAEVA